MKKLKLLVAFLFLGLFLISCNEIKGPTALEKKTANVDEISLQKPDTTITLVDNMTLGFYNAKLGATLDVPPPYPPRLFPLANCSESSCNAVTDPTIFPAPEPDLTAASTILGNWLSTNPFPLNSNWIGPQSIPLTWTTNTETAIVYQINAGPGGITNLKGNFGVDNGIFVWVNGKYKFGALGPGEAIVYEYTNIDLGNLPPGLNFIQILREDHGVTTGYAVKITGILASPILSVNIDIKPGDDPNYINPRSKGVIPVAILTNNNFDATTVAPLSVKFGANAATEAHEKGHIEDIDHDGDNDLVLHFRTQDTGIHTGDLETCLSGHTTSGNLIQGCDSIQTVGKQ